MATYKAKKEMIRGRMKAQAGLVNGDMGGGGQPAQPQGPAPSGQQQQQSGGGISVDVAVSVNANGQSQPLGNVSIKQPDDIKKLVQMIAGVFQQGGGQPQGQPAGEPQPQQ